MVQQPDDDAIAVEPVKAGRGVPGVGRRWVFARRAVAERLGLVGVNPLAVGGEQGEGDDRPGRREAKVSFPPDRGGFGYGE